MKKIIVAFLVGMFIVAFGAVCVQKNQNWQEELCRIHVKANSNDAFDQYVKYEVKDKVLGLFEPVVKQITDFDKLKSFLLNSKNLIAEYVNMILFQKKCVYTASIDVGICYFEEKQIDSVKFKAGNYFSYVINLGEAKGNNWWGLLFPKLSFFGRSESGNDYIIYKSKLQEIFKNST